MRAYGQDSLIQFNVFYFYSICITKSVKLPTLGANTQLYKSNTFATIIWLWIVGP
jgi:hypothetical protein